MMGRLQKASNGFANVVGAVFAYIGELGKVPGASQ